MHAKCLRNQVHISWAFLNNLHKSVVKYAGSPTMTVSKAAVVAMQAQEHVITPVSTITSVATYLAELADSDKVIIASGHERFHGLTQKPLNNP